MERVEAIVQGVSAIVLSLFDVFAIRYRTCINDGHLIECSAFRNIVTSTDRVTAMTELSAFNIALLALAISCTRQNFAAAPDGDSGKVLKQFSSFPKGDFGVVGANLVAVVIVH